MAQERIAEIERLLRIAEDDLSHLQRQKEFLLDQIISLRNERQSLLHPVVAENPVQYSRIGLTNQSDEQAKIQLFRALSRGREDVYARRFESRKTGKSGYQPDCKNAWVMSICQKPKIKCNQCDHRQFVPVSDAVIRSHLMGRDPSGPASEDFTIGIYPLLSDEMCWFLAVDFDGPAWKEDAQAFRNTCEMRGISASLEKSRSGNGAHIWLFFSEPVQARQARILGSLLLTETNERRPEISLKSYDRFFPNQDTLPQRGFGNLIALPLQRRPRESGNSVFLDANLDLCADQWAYLSSIRRLSADEVGRLVKEISCYRQELGPRSAFVEVTDEVPWEAKRFTDWKRSDVQGPFPDMVNLALADQLYIPKHGLSPSLRNRIIRLAAFPNPEFLRAQAMRLSIYGKPRIICCANDFTEYIALPRGCLEELLDLLHALGVSATMEDRRVCGINLNLQFHGELNELQREVVEALLKQDTGVLVAPTAFGKTVVAAWLISRRQVNTLVLVHTRQLMDQWINRLNKFLKPPEGTIGQIGAGNKRDTGLIDVGMLQSLIHRGEINPVVENYGQIMVDECHHISARSFEQVARAAKSRYITGFSATVERRDGHHPIIFMQCGPVRHRITVKKQQDADEMNRSLIIRETGFVLPDTLAQLKSLTIHDVYDSLMRDEQRNQLIVADALSCVEKGCCPLVISERREHVKILTGYFALVISNLVVLTGGMSQKQRVASISNLQQDGPRLVLATGRYLGEGFDDDRLDTLLLAMPISWKGTLTQYAGRLNRTRQGKREITIYDYADLEVPMLKRMYQRRLRSYKRLGYVPREKAESGYKQRGQNGSDTIKLLLINNSIKKD